MDAISTCLFEKKILKYTDGEPDSLKSDFESYFTNEFLQV